VDLFGGFLDNLAVIRSEYNNFLRNYCAKKKLGASCGHTFGHFMGPGGHAQKPLERQPSQHCEATAKLFSQYCVLWRGHPEWIPALNPGARKARGARSSITTFGEFGFFVSAGGHRCGHVRSAGGQQLGRTINEWATINYKWQKMGQK
jgi:hypothetical protein